MFRMKTTQPFALFLAVLLLAGCETSPGPETRTSATSSRSAFAEPPHDRPGLGTKWGETRQSRVEAASFERANPRRPFAVASIYYNDAAGVRAMAGAVAWTRRAPFLADPAAALVSVELRDESGRLLPGLVVGDRWFVIGEEGRRYSITVRNRTKWRLEIVLSVDGLDVIDGRPASFGKRGYIMGPHARLIVDGFRQSTEAVAAFRFGPVRESYANEKYRSTRNVGVIGIALFNEAGTDPWTWNEVRRRLRANPFPGQFATPP